MPALARQDTPTGATTFARYYVAVLDYASHTGDISTFQQLGKCGTCQAQAKGISDFFESGGHVEGGNLQVVRTRVVRFVSKAALVSVVYNQAAGKSISSDGKAEDSSPLKGETFALTLGRTTDSWTVQKLQVVA